MTWRTRRTSVARNVSRWRNAPKRCCVILGLIARISSYVSTRRSSPSVNRLTKSSTRPDSNRRRHLAAGPLSNAMAWMSRLQSKTARIRIGNWLMGESCDSWLWQPVVKRGVFAAAVDAWRAAPLNQVGFPSCGFSGSPAGWGEEFRQRIYPPIGPVRSAGARIPERSCRQVWPSAPLPSTVCVAVRYHGVKARSS